MMKNEMTVEELDRAIAVFKELREIAKSKKDGPIAKSSVRLQNKIIKTEISAFSDVDANTRYEWLRGNGVSYHIQSNESKNKIKGIGKLVHASINDIDVAIYDNEEKDEYVLVGEFYTLPVELIYTAVSYSKIIEPYVDRGDQWGRPKDIDDDF